MALFLFGVIAVNAKTGSAEVKSLTALLLTNAFFC
jgi:hypothetical protein